MVPERGPLHQVEVDVVVIGGGVAGCWVTKELSHAGYATALVSLEGLGGGQTAHSHVYLHRGHLYREEARNELSGGGSTLTTDLRLASRLWDEWLAGLVGGGHHLDAAPSTGLFGFRSGRDAQDVEAAVWSPLGLRSQPVGPPPVLSGSALTAFRRVDARCLDAEALIRALAPRSEAFTVDAAAVTPVIDGTRIEAVRVRTASGELSVRGRATVLAAGAGNRQLLNGFPPGAVPVMRDRPSFMLVVVDDSGPFLEPLSGVFVLNGDDSLFLVSRQEGARTAWLLSDACTETDHRDWLAYVLAELREVFPHVWQGREHLQWGWYDAPKAEVSLDEAFQRQVHSHVALHVGDNVVGVWPTKLTLAPLAALDVLEMVDDLLGSPTQQLPSSPPNSGARIGPERWRRVVLRGWDGVSAALHT